MKQERNAYDDVIKPDSEPVINVSNGVDFGASGTGHRRTIAGSWRILAILGVLAGLISLFSRDEPESRGETASEDVRKPPAAVTLADTVSRKPKEQDNKRTFRLFSRSVATLEAKDRSGSTISQGSGFLINREGLLVTNLHVIPMSSASVCVTFSDERERIAEGVVAISEEDDLAVLKVPKRLLPMPCRIADTGETSRWATRSVSLAPLSGYLIHCPKGVFPHFVEMRVMSYKSRLRFHRVRAGHRFSHPRVR